MTLRNIRSIPMLRPLAACTILSALLLTGSPGMASSAHVPADKALNIESHSTATKDAVTKFRRDYEERNAKEFAHLPKEAQSEIVTALNHCLDLGYKTELLKVNKILKDLNNRYANEPVLLWHLAMNYFLIGRRMEDARSDEQIELFQAGLDSAQHCMKVAPNNADCWLNYAASKGALSLVAGIFETLAEISEVRDALHKAYELAPNEPYPLAPWDVDTLHAATGALAEFYRLAPDWWLFKLLSGVRGDKEKSWKFASKMPVREIGTANIVARSALCQGADGDDPELIQRGIEEVVKGVNLELIQSFDEPEYRRLARLYNAIADLKDPDTDDYFDLGCHEFGNDERDKLKAKSSTDKKAQANSKP